jgi:hypothetical protein
MSLQCVASQLPMGSWSYVSNLIHWAKEPSNAQAKALPPWR